MGVYVATETGTLEQRVWSNLWLNFDNVRHQLQESYVASYVAS